MQALLRGGGVRGFDGFRGQRVDGLGLDMLGHCQGEHHRDDEDACDRVTGEDIADELRHMVKEAGDQRDADADGERGGGDQRIALVQTALAQHGNAGDDDCAEHHNGAAAEHAFGQRGEECADGREQTGQHERKRTEHDREAVDDLCHRDQADILAEGCDGRAAEHAAGDGGDKAVAGQRAGQLPDGDIPAQAAVADRRRVADGFGGGDEENQRDGDDGAELKLRREVQQLREGDNAQLRDGAADLREIYHAETDGGNIADDQTGQNIELLPEALGQRLIDQAGHQGDGADQQVLPAAEVIGIGRAIGVDADRQQREADGRYDAGRDDRGHKAAPIFDCQAQNALDTAADDDTADHNAVILRGIDHHG